MKSFNVSAACNPRLHYMVDISERLRKIKAMVDAGQYFTINRARQYGKTTTLQALGKYLEREYTVLSLDFQMLGAASFQSENTFSLAFARIFLKSLQRNKEAESDRFIQALEVLENAVLERREDFVLQELFEHLSDICGGSKKPMVLFIDEVDSATNNQVFLDFLAQLRVYYINREEFSTFQSVILAGVYDVKNLKRKFVAEDEHKVNSPWNTHAGNEENGRLRTFDDCPWDDREPAPYRIAADFLVDMSFSAKDISGMLAEYENDYQTGMDIGEMAELIYDYTSGYPYLVSRICKLMDERVAGTASFPDKASAWTRAGLQEAVKLLLGEPNTLFESLIGKLEDYPELNGMLRDLLFQGKEIAYVMGIRSIEMALMFGFVRRENNTVVIANRIFETLLYNLYLTSPKMQQAELYAAGRKEKNQFIRQGQLDMKLVLEKFVTHFDELYGDRGETFLEEDGRRYFLLYLRPIINGVGNYYIEARTRNMERTDVVVDYGGQQYVIELKIWRGNEYHTRGEAQLLEYLDYYHVQKGYMLSFNFNKKKRIGVTEHVLGDKILVEAVV